MDPVSREYLTDLYSKLLMHHGDSPAALHWSGKGQEARYRAICNNSDLKDGTKLLDYGCGKADLYAFLLSEDIQTNYTGVDITPSLIELAAKKYPECSFLVHDIDDGPLDSMFEIAVICGVFNYRIEGATEGLYNSMRLLFKHVSRTLVVNMLSADSRQKRPELNYIDPSVIEKFAKKTISANTQVRTDLVDSDIFLFISR